MSHSVPIKVAVRCRPMVQLEKEKGANSCVRLFVEHNQVIADGRQFNFDAVFGPDSSQEEVFDSIAAPMAERFFDGYNCTIFAYGQTGSGKTFTMGTEERAGRSDSSAGLISRLLRRLFSKAADEAEAFQFSFCCSMLEIYNETVFDLLGEKEPLAIREHQTDGIYVQNLTITPVNDHHGAMKCLEQGCLNRSQGQTAMNMTSSRSHAIFTIYMDKVSQGENSESYRAKLNLVDLAGSERLKKTLAQGDRMREGIKINEGLLALGNVISALTETSSSRVHIPYRDSKLTRLLQDSLGGNSVTAMVACVSPADTNQEETVNTLRYAERAKKIKNKPIVNVDPTSAELQRLRQENAALRQALGYADNGPVATQSMAYGKELLLARERIAVLESQVDRSAMHQERYLKQSQMLLQSEYHAGLLQDSVKEVMKKLKELKETSDLNVVHDIIDSLTSSLAELLSTLESEREGLEGYTLAISVDEEDSVERECIDDPRFSSLRREIMEKQTELVNMENGLKKDWPVDNVHLEKIADLMDRVNALSAEKEELMEQLKKLSNSHKVNEGRRRRVCDLEKQIAELNKKVAELRKYEAAKAASERQIRDLKDQVYNLKQAQVRLIRQQREEVAKNRKLKAETERQMNILRRQGVKMEHEALKTKRNCDMMLNTYQRKYEAAISAGRRLQDQLDRVKCYERMSRKTTGTSEKVLSEQVRQQLRIAVGAAETKNYCNELLNQREILHKQWTKLNLELRSLGNPAGANDNAAVERRALMESAADLQEKIELCNDRIQELRSRLADYELTDKYGHFGMVNNLQDAKEVVKILFEHAISAHMQQIHLMSYVNEVTETVGVSSTSAHKDEPLESVAGVSSQPTGLKSRGRKDLTKTERPSVLSKRVHESDGEGTKTPLPMEDERNWPELETNQTFVLQNMYLPTPRRLRHLVASSSGVGQGSTSDEGAAKRRRT